MSAPLRGLSFDLDDTLWETGPVIARAERLALQWLDEHAPAAVDGRSAQELLEHRRAWYATQPHLAHDFTALRRGWFAQLFAETGVAESLADAAFDYFWRARNDVEPFPSAMAAVTRLRRSYKLGTITNGNACVHHIGIGHHFDFVITAIGAGVAKPHPGIFEQALEVAGLRAEDMAHVGDDPITDVGGARSAGLRTIWVSAGGQRWNPGHGPSPDATVTSVAEVPDLVAAWG